jgi:hypothetical protein
LSKLVLWYRAKTYVLKFHQVHFRVSGKIIGVYRAEDLYVKPSSVGYRSIRASESAERGGKAW